MLCKRPNVLDGKAVQERGLNAHAVFYNRGVGRRPLHLACALSETTFRGPSSLPMYTVQPPSYQFSNDSRKMSASSTGPTSLGAMLSCRCCLSAPLTSSSI